MARASSTFCYHPYAQCLHVCMHPCVALRTVPSKVRRLLWQSRAARTIQCAYRAKMARRRIRYFQNRENRRRELDRMTRGQRVRWESDKHLCLLPYESESVAPPHAAAPTSATATSPSSSSSSSSSSLSSSPQPSLPTSSPAAPGAGGLVRKKWEVPPKDIARWEPSVARRECAVMLRQCDITDSAEEKDGYIKVIL